MRWKPKPTKPVQQPTRSINRFAIIPTECEDDRGQPIVVWLEWYEVYQEHGYDGYGFPSWRTLARFAR